MKYRALAVLLLALVGSAAAARTLKAANLGESRLLGGLVLGAMCCNVLHVGPPWGTPGRGTAHQQRL